MKERKIHKKYNTVWVICPCHCGEMFSLFDKRGRKMQYINGHHPAWNKDKLNCYSEEILNKMSLAQIKRFKDFDPRKGVPRPKHSGVNHPMFGKHPSVATTCKNKETNILISKRGEEHHLWKGGRKITRSRAEAKRNRLLGFDPVNEPISDDMVAHHCTKEYVVYVPEFINKARWHKIETGIGMDEINFYTLNYLIFIYNKED